MMTTTMILMGSVNRANSQCSSQHNSKRRNQHSWRMMKKTKTHLYPCRNQKVRLTYSTIVRCQSNLSNRSHLKCHLHYLKSRQSLLLPKHCSIRMKMKTSLWVLDLNNRPNPPRCLHHLSLHNKKLSSYGMMMKRTKMKDLTLVKSLRLLPLR